jgi:hypothetical protein
MVTSGARPILVRAPAAPGWIITKSDRNNEDFSMMVIGKKKSLQPATGRRSSRAWHGGSAPNVQAEQPFSKSRLACPGACTRLRRKLLGEAGRRFNHFNFKDCACRFSHRCAARLAQLSQGISITNEPAAHGRRER